MTQPVSQNPSPPSPDSTSLVPQMEKLWKFFRENHDLTLTDSELSDVIHAVLGEKDAQRESTRGELLPCPFCGSSDLQHQQATQRVRCGNVMNCPLDTWFTKEQWNTRAMPSASSGAKSQADSEFPKDSLPASAAVEQERVMTEDHAEILRKYNRAYLILNGAMSIPAPIEIEEIAQRLVTELQSLRKTFREKEPLDRIALNLQMARARFIGRVLLSDLFRNGLIADHSEGKELLKERDVFAEME